MRHSVEHERHQRILRTESAAANVIRHWLTGEVYRDEPVQHQRRRPYRKTSRTRGHNLANRDDHTSGQVASLFDWG